MNPMMNTRKKIYGFLLLSLMVLAPFAMAQKTDATSVAVYPFASDSIVGIAVSERLSEALMEASQAGEDLQVVEPLASLSLIPPLVIEGGFLSPLVLMGSGSAGNDPVRLAANFDGISMVRESLGVDVAVSGTIVNTPETLNLELFLSSETGAKRYTITAPETAPQELVDTVLSILRYEAGLELATQSKVIDLSSSYGDYISILGLLTSGIAFDLTEGLSTLLEQDDAEESWGVLKDDLEAVVAGDAGSDPIRMAALAMLLNIDRELTLDYFSDMYTETGLASAQLWYGSISDEMNDEAAATEAFKTAAAEFPYGKTANVAYRVGRGLTEDTSELTALSETGTASSLIAAAFSAQAIGETDIERVALKNLSRVSPSMLYSFERLSFIAFDKDDAQDAAEVLAIATDLAPDSSLYWTNLGWAYYLIGFLEDSEAASIAAIDIDAGQNIAWFNLGLAQVVTGRLDDAMESYRNAILIDPEIDDEAVKDLVNALDLFPNEPSIHFALASLYEAEGKKDDAIEQFAAYVEDASDTGFIGFANSRLMALTAPPAPITITEGVALSLAGISNPAATFSPGDRLNLNFELFTEGIELPTAVTVTTELLAASGNAIENSLNEQNVSIPRDAVAFLIKDVPVDIPTIVADGDYTISLRAATTDGREATTTLEVSLSGSPSLLRQLISRGIVMVDLVDSLALYDESALGSDDADERLFASLQGELVTHADIAKDALPVVEFGRFEGLDGGELFEQTSATDIEDFVRFLLSSETDDISFNFIDAFAQWALDGAETP